MEFGEELTMLILMIVGLLVAYFGIQAWSRRSGKGNSETLGPAGRANQGSGMEASPDEDGASGSFAAGMQRRSESRNNEKRFHLQGRDAETAAKVLKRMLKEDRDGSGS